MAIDTPARLLLIMAPVVFINYVIESTDQGKLSKGIGNKPLEEWTCTTDTIPSHLVMSVMLDWLNLWAVPFGNDRIGRDGCEIYNRNSI